MPNIDWLYLVSAGLAVLSTVVGFHLARQNERRWLAAVAEQLHAHCEGRRLTGERDGIPFTVTYTPVSNESPRWTVELPGARTPPLVARLQGKADARLAWLGLEQEARLKDPELDARLWLGAPDAASATTFLEDEGVAAALGAIWPLSENAADGGVGWIQLGEGLQAQIDVSQISEASFDERLEVLVARLVRLARACAAAPPVQTQAAPLPPLATEDRFHREFAMLGVATSVVLGALILIGGWMKVSMAPDPRWVGGLAAVAAVGAVAWSVRGRGTPLFRSRLWRVPMFAVGGAFAGLLVPVANLVPAEPPRTATVRVLAAEPEDLFLLDLWSLELDGVGTFIVPADEARELPVGAQVRASWRQGVLGRPQLLEVVRVDGP